MRDGLITIRSTKTSTTRSSSRPVTSRWRIKLIVLKIIMYHFESNYEIDQKDEINYLVRSPDIWIRVGLMTIRSVQYDALFERARDLKVIWQYDQLHNSPVIAKNKADNVINFMGYRLQHRINSIILSDYQICQYSMGSYAEGSRAREARYV